MASIASTLANRLATGTGSSFWLYPAAVLCAIALMLVV